MESITTLADLSHLYRSFKVTTVYVKHLSLKQDNDKNQIYLGKIGEPLANLFPSEIITRGPSTSTKKRHSEKGESIIERKILNFFWIEDFQHSHLAPSVKLIEYFQYPEIRMSGFLKGCKNPPDSLRKKHLLQYGKRILTFGMTPEGTVLGYVLTAKHDPLVRSFPTLEQHPAIAVLRWFDVDTYRTPQRDPRELLCEEIRQICLGGWHWPRKLKKKGGTPIPYKGRNAGGLTFEALLDIPENPVSQPDKHGHEIKTFSGSKISLFTPAPDGGIRCQYKTNDDFLRDYGWPAVRKPGQSLVFNGTHCCTKANSKFGSRLILEGYDPQADEFVREREQIRVILRDGRSQGELFAWSFHKLADKWEKKHSLAVYVQSIKNKSTGDYRFERNIYLCSGTTIWHFFKALAKGAVVYDPAHEFGVNERHQWRISSAKSKMKERLELLYDHVEIKDVTKM